MKASNSGRVDARDVSACFNCKSEECQRSAKLCEHARPRFALVHMSFCHCQADSSPGRASTDCCQQPPTSVEPGQDCSMLPACGCTSFHRERAQWTSLASVSPVTTLLVTLCYAPGRLRGFLFGNSTDVSYLVLASKLKAAIGHPV